MSKDPLIYGIRPVLEAIQAGKDVDKLLIQNGLRGEHYHELLTLLKEREIPFQFVPIQKLNRVTAKNHQGVIGYLSNVIYQSIEDILPALFEAGITPLLLIVDRITDVRNFGALSRTAEAAGVHAILFPSRGSAALHEDAIKTSAGALMKIPLCRSHNLKTTLQFLKDSGVKITGVTEKTDNQFFAEDFTVPVALLLGSEEDGISPAYLRMCDSLVSIPMLGEIKSLNVSVAGGIVMYEVVSQRIRHGI
ncbi:MAG: 23S rRNA (guanosine(2251)-2'-O)-methyltransferase RlmB [Bacteroidetes bacterium]|nr:23S rRNA (guanosine(2251)-2'-O)-methyltransferase RlmB [Bacteroidota bacterium]